jgi:hypothetical protein
VRFDSAFGEPAEQHVSGDADAAADAANAWNAAAGDRGVRGFPINAHQIGDFFYGQDWGENVVRARPRYKRINFHDQNIIHLHYFASAYGGFAAANTCS